MRFVRCLLPALMLITTGTSFAADSLRSIEKQQASAAHGPRFFYVCDEAPPFAIGSFETDPPSARFDSGPDSIVLVIQRSASGARYAGQGTEFWGKGREASLTRPDGRRHACRVAHESS